MFEVKRLASGGFDILKLPLLKIGRRIACLFSQQMHIEQLLCARAIVDNRNIVVKSTDRIPALMEFFLYLDQGLASFSVENMLFL